VNPSTEKIDEAALAILFLTLHDQYRAWKGIDWDVLDRLYRQGFIENPATKAKSVVFTDAGLRRAAEAFAKQFAGSPVVSGVKSRSRENCKIVAAGGTTGFICRSAVDGQPFFRVYAPDGGFVDYQLGHDDLEVTISAGAQASFYRSSAGNVLDHSPEVLGKSEKRSRAS
jgi:hypothetical protein